MRPEKLKRLMSLCGYGLYGGVSELARETGIHYSTLSYLLSGQRQPSIKTATTLVKAFNKRLQTKIYLEDLIK